MDVHGVGWFLVVVVFVVLPLLSRPTVLRMVGPRLVRLGRWVRVWLAPVPEVDQEAEALRWLLRRQQLVDNVRRLQRIVATDASMSATRQMANRLAYGQLLRELEHTPDVSEAMFGYAAANPRTSPGLSLAVDSFRRAPTVEILEIGWRRS